MLVSWIILAAVVVFILAAIAFFMWGIKKAFELLINSLIGFFALWITKAVVVSTLVINLWSVLLVAILGIFGFAIVLLLHIFHIAF